MIVLDREPSRLTLGLALFLAMTYPSLIAWLYFQALGAGDGSLNRWQQLTYAGGKVVQFAFPILFVWITTRRWPRLKPASARGVYLGVISGLLVTALILGVYYGSLRGSPLLGQTPAKLRAKLDEFGVGSLGGYLALTVFLALAHSFLEEYYWRWFVFGQLRSLLPLMLAIVLSSLAFMAHHVIILHVYLPGRFVNAVLPFSLGVAVGGAFWAWLYQRTGSLLGPWLSHMIVDTAIFIVGWDLLQRSAG
jgi:uncharacterized protein